MAQGVDESRVFFFPPRLKRHCDPPSFLPAIVNNSIVVFYLRDHQNIQTRSKPVTTTSGPCVSMVIMHRNFIRYFCNLLLQIAAESYLFHDMSNASIFFSSMTSFFFVFHFSFLLYSTMFRIFHYSSSLRRITFFEQQTYRSRNNLAWNLLNAPSFHKSISVRCQFVNLEYSVFFYIKAHNSYSASLRDFYNSVNHRRSNVFLGCHYLKTRTIFVERKRRMFVENVGTSLVDQQCNQGNNVFTTFCWSCI